MSFGGWFFLAQHTSMPEMTYSRELSAIFGGRPQRATPCEILQFEKQGGGMQTKGPGGGGIGGGRARGDPDGDDKRRPVGGRPSTTI